MRSASYPLFEDGGDHLDLILATAQIGIWELNVTTGQALRNLRHDQIFGYDHLLKEWSADIFLTHVVEEDRVRVRNLLTDAVNGRKPWEFQARIRRADDAQRWISAKGMPKFDDDGNMTKLIGHVIDITENKETEDRLKLLTQELNHRVANTFTILNSMIRHSAKKSTTVTEFAETLTHRLAALARSNRILTARAGERSSLHEILEMEFNAFEGWHERIDVHGSADIWFSGEASEALALIFHELLTNAVKHGALSVPSGRITLSIISDAVQKTEIEWGEVGGPPVATHRVPGIGSTIMARAMRDRGSVDIDFSEEGLVCRIIVNEGSRRDVSGESRPEAKPLPALEVEANGSLEGFKVLVVEDDPIIGLDISEILEADGASVVGPHSKPVTAIAAISEGPDVALLDVNLGHETSSGVASQLLRERIPFLVLSGQLDRSELEAEFRNAPFVSKPFSDREIVVGLMKLLSHSA